MLTPDGQEALNCLDGNANKSAIKTWMYGCSQGKHSLDSRFETVCDLS